jgi:hypothetical protein
VLLYHVTPHAEEILREEFRSGRDFYGLPYAIDAVFLADQIVDPMEARGLVLEVEFPDDFALDDYAVTEEGAPAEWRHEWTVPAEVIKSYATVRPGPPNPYADWADPQKA